MKKSAEKRWLTVGYLFLFSLFLQTADVRQLKSLQKYGVNLSAGDYDGRTPLHIAASDGSLEVAEYLLNNGASVHIKDRDQNTPLMSAIMGDHFEIVSTHFIGLTLKISTLIINHRYIINSSFIHHNT